MMSFSSSDLTTVQAAADGQVGSNMKKNSSPNKQRDGSAAAAAKEVPRRKKCSGDKHKKKRNSNDEKPKRRRRCNNPRPRRPPPPIIPEARVVQEPSDRACICISEDEDDRLEHLAKGAIRRVTERLRQERLLQESIARHTRVFSYRNNPEYFSLVYRHNNNDELEGDDDEDDDEEDECWK